MDFTDVIKTLSTEKTSALFSPNKFTTVSRYLPYGYYDIKSPALGSIMINVNFIDGDDDRANAVIIRSRKFGDEYRVFDAFNPKSFMEAIEFVSMLKTEASKLTQYENFMKWCCLLNSKVNRIAIQKHYLNARVAYDVISDVMRAVSRNMQEDHDGYKIVAQLDDYNTETIKINLRVEYNQYDIPYDTVSVMIPKVGFYAKFNDYETYHDIAVFNKVHQLLDDGKRSGKTVLQSGQDFDFSRWDPAYCLMMQKIITVRRNNMKK